MANRYSTKDSHQRTSLFSTSSTLNDDIYRPSSPYAAAPKSKDYTLTMMDQMESQSNDELSSMLGKVSLLKSLSTRMNSEINSNKHINNINENFERMVPVVKRYGRRVGVVGHDGWLTFKGWCVFFGLVMLFFFFRWLI